jgi:hypothetical protein
MRIAVLALTLSLLVGLSQAQFIPEKTVTLSGGNLGSFLAKGDFNGDGKLDVLFSATDNASGGKSELVVFPGNGTGGFGAPIATLITSLNNPQIWIAGDLNGDGIPDAVITGTDPITAAAEIGVMLADGTGKFMAPVVTRNSVLGRMVLGDFTGDGKVDLAILSAPVTVYPGKGNGTFGAAVSSTFNYGANCAAVADFNKDTKMDITTGGAVLLGNGDGTFQAPLTVVNGTCDVAVGDFNKDGIPDIVTGDAEVGSQARVFLGDGTGKFTTSTAYPAGDGAGRFNGMGFAIDNFNADTNLDIAVASATDNTITMLLGKADGTFTAGKTFVDSTTGILSGDFNGDHKTDIAVRTRMGFSVILGKGNGTLTAQMAENGQPGETIHLADFNGDGKVDVIEFAFDGRNGGVLLGDGTGNFGKPIPLPSSCLTGAGVVADFNRDKTPDVAFAAGTGGGVAVCLGNGDGTFKDAVIYDAGVQHGFVVFGDFNHDGKMDLAASDVGGVSILLGNGDGTFQTAIPTAASNFAFPVTGDFNHDGKLDIAYASGSQVSVLLGKGDGTFEAPVTSPNVNGFGPLAAGDLNKDGNLDLVSLNAGIPQGLNILLGNGDGTFKAPAFLKVSGPRYFQIRDMNGDGKLDLIANGPGFLDVMLGNGDGTFQTTKNYLAPQGNNSLAAADINGDGLLDVAYLTARSKPSSGTLTVFLNQGH